MKEWKKTKKNANPDLRVVCRLKPIDPESMECFEVDHEENTIEAKPSISYQNQIKKYAFSKVFGPETDQVQVYQDICGPMLKDFIETSKPQLRLSSFASKQKKVP